MSLIGTTEDGLLIGVYIRREVLETEEEFMTRCVADYEAVGKGTSEAQGICATTWRGKTDKDGTTEPSAVTIAPGETKEQFMDR